MSLNPFKNKLFSQWLPKVIAILRYLVPDETEKLKLPSINYLQFVLLQK